MLQIKLSITFAPHITGEPSNEQLLTGSRHSLSIISILYCFKSTEKNAAIHASYVNNFINKLMKNVSLEFQIKDFSDSSKIIKILECVMSVVIINIISFFNIVHFVLYCYKKHVSRW